MLMAITLSGCLNLRRQYRDSDAGVGVDGGVSDSMTDVTIEESLLDRIDSATYAVQVSDGDRRTCALLSDRSVWCWGGRTYHGAPLHFERILSHRFHKIG